MREKVLKAIPAAIERSSSGGGPRLDLDEYARKTAIRNAYDNRDYAVCLGLLDERVKTCPELRGNQTCSLFRAYLLKRLDRAHDAEIELNRANVQPGTVNTPDGLRLHQVEERLILWEALGCYREAREFLSQTIPPVVESIPDKHSALESWNDAQRLYNLRARMQILDGDYAGALADENAALALPPMRFDVPGVHVTPAQVQQTQLNTVVMNWELLEQEFPAYGDYLEANGSPEPKPDLRNLDDE